MTSTLIFVKYLKPAQYESKLFAVVKYNQNKHQLKPIVKTHKDKRYLYIKDKYLNNVELEEYHYYAFKIYIDSYVNKDLGKEIHYIGGLFDKTKKNKAELIQLEGNDRQNFIETNRNDYVDSSDEEELN